MGNYDTNIIGYRNQDSTKVWCLDCANVRAQAQYPLHRNEKSEFPLGARCEVCGRTVYTPSPRVSQKVEDLEGDAEFLDEVEEFVDGFFPTPPEAEESEYTWDLDGEQGSVPVQFVEYLNIFDELRGGK